MGNVALFLAIMLFLVALRIDIRNKKDVMSWALLVPFIWLTMKLSRKLSRWLNIGSFQMVRSDDYVSLLEKGNISDQIFLSSLFLIGLLILFKRRQKVYKILSDNKIWVLLICYCLASILWSESPKISLRRFIKDIIVFVMVMIVLTENNPFESFKAIVRRNIYLLIPLSLVFSKYFPAIGRYQTSSWNFIYTGVATHKNSLGILCLVSILILFIEIWPHAGNRVEKISREFKAIILLYIGLTVMLLAMANSMTTNICLLIGLSVYVSRLLKRHMTKIVVLFSLCFITGIDQYIIDNVREVFLGLVNRGQTISGRMELWEVVLNTPINKMIGPGYSAFWLGDRMREIIERFIFVPKQAHNGYIEIYINLGIIGLSIFLITLLSTYKKLIQKWDENNIALNFSLSFMALYLIYNMTEATFLFNSSPLWFIFVYIAFDNNRQVDVDTDADTSTLSTQN